MGVCPMVKKQNHKKKTTELLVPVTPVAVLAALPLAALAPALVNPLC